MAVTVIRRRPEDTGYHAMGQALNNVMDSILKIKQIKGQRILNDIVMNAAASGADPAQQRQMVSEGFQKARTPQGSRGILDRIAGAFNPNEPIFMPNAMEDTLTSYAARNMFQDEYQTAYRNNMMRNSLLSQIAKFEEIEDRARARINRAEDATDKQIKEWQDEAERARRGVMSSWAQIDALSGQGPPAPRPPSAEALGVDTITAADSPVNTVNPNDANVQPVTRRPAAQAFQVPWGALPETPTPVETGVTHEKKTSLANSIWNALKNLTSEPVRTPTATTAKGWDKRVMGQKATPGVVYKFINSLPPEKQAEISQVPPEYFSKLDQETVKTILEILKQGKGGFEQRNGQWVFDTEIQWR